MEAEAKNVSRANLKHLAQVTRFIMVLGSEMGRTVRKAGFRGSVSYVLDVFI